MMNGGPATRTRSKLLSMMKVEKQLPMEIILNVADHMQASGSLKSLASLGTLNKAVNEKIVPMQYRVIKFFSPKAIQAFFEYYIKNSPDPPADPHPLNISRDYGERQTYLRRLMENMEIQCSARDLSGQSLWIRRLFGLSMEERLEKERIGASAVQQSDKWRLKTLSIQIHGSGNSICPSAIDLHSSERELLDGNSSLSSLLLVILQPQHVLKLTRYSSKEGTQFHQGKCDQRAAGWDNYSEHHSMQLVDGKFSLDRDSPIVHVMNGFAGTFHGFCNDPPTFLLSSKTPECHPKHLIRSSPTGEDSQAQHLIVIPGGTVEDQRAWGSDSEIVRASPEGMQIRVFTPENPPFTDVNSWREWLEGNDVYLESIPGQWKTSEKPRNLCRAPDVI